MGKSNVRRTRAEPGRCHSSPRRQAWNPGLAAKHENRIRRLRRCYGNAGTSCRQGFNGEQYNMTFAQVFDAWERGAIQNRGQTV